MTTTVVVLICNPAATYGSWDCTIVLPELDIFHLFHFNYSGEHYHIGSCIVVFNLHFLHGDWSQAHFRLFTGYFDLLFCELSVHIFCRYFFVSCCLFLLVCVKALYILHMSSLLDISPQVSLNRLGSLTSSDVLLLIKCPMAFNAPGPPNYYIVLLCTSTNIRAV